jgi:serine/threonine protein kinase/tetratricopeptide (TPR) repeat protein
VTLAAGARLGPYEILAPLGAGGMGEVYRARDARLGREVAIKVLPERLVGDQEHRARFEREARAVAAVSHPNILAIHDFGEQGGLFYAVTELLEGETLRQRIVRERLSWRRGVEIATAVSEGLAAAHSRGIVHRDIKPENIFLTSDGLVKILDFGLARPPVVGSEDQTSTPTESMQTAAGTVLGTVGYMSPEQVSGEPADARSDIFSLGCVLYEMLAGKRAFSGASPGQTMAAILRDQPPEIAVSGVQVPEGLGRIVTRCLEKSPSERFQSARDLAFALRELAGGSAAVLRASVPTRSHRLPVIGLVVVVAAVVAALFLLRDRPRPVSHKIESVAVLPLENLTGDASQEYFADGMTEELIGDLSKISALRVPSRTSIMRYRKTTKSLPEIAKELGVDAIVEGSVSRSGQQVKITAQLIDASKDKHLWADSFQRDLKDVLALQGEVARAIAQEVRAKLTPEEVTSLAASRPVNPEAYEAYLQGRYYWYRRTPADTVRSRDSFQKAVDADPGYAVAWAGLADAYLLLGSASYGTSPPAEAFPKMLAAARKALELDDRVAEAHTMVGFYLHLWDRDHAEAEKEFRRALEIDPRYAQGHQYYAFFLNTFGRFEEAIREVKLGRDLDPLSLVQNANVGYVFHFAHRDDEAIEWCMKTLTMDPNFLRARWTLGMAYEQKRTYSEAIAELEKARHLSGNGPTYVGALGHAYAVAGRSAEARRCLVDLREMARTRFVPSDPMGLIYVGLGDPANALEFLEKAADEHSIFLNIGVDPRFDPLRSEPRFDALLRRLNLPMVRAK